MPKEIGIVLTASGRHSLAWLVNELAEQRASGKRIVTTNGCFDLIHPGHVAFLQQARACGDLLIVLLNTDNSVSSLKGPSRPILEQEGRASVLLALRSVDYVVLFDEPLPNEVLSVIRPDVHCKASDYQVSQLPEAKVVEQGGGSVKILPHVNGYSTSNLVDRVRQTSPITVETSAEGADDVTEVREALQAGSEVLKDTALKLSVEIVEVAQVVSAAILEGHKILICGNGGSAADSQHFAAELVGRYLRERQPWPAIALTVDTSILTAVGNDYGFDQVFSRQVRALGGAGDVLLAISTSGNSSNVIAAVEAANAIGMKTVGLTGMNQAQITKAAHFCLQVPAKETSLIQQAHISILHVLCDLVEKRCIDPADE